MSVLKKSTADAEKVVVDTVTNEVESLVNHNSNWFVAAVTNPGVVVMVVMVVVMAVIVAYWFLG